MKHPSVIVDANQAVARIAYHFSEIIPVFPITPATPLGEWSEEYTHKGIPNFLGQVPEVIELQSEGGVAATMHGALSTGALATTFTASQGLLLMLPEMYKMSGELLPGVIHVTARSLAYHALSIFGDHSDVMSARATGFTMLASSSVQEAQDLAFLAHLTAIATRVPVLHFYDGFRTSHEIQKISELDLSLTEQMLDKEALAAFRARGLSPEHPMAKVGAQNPDVYFQAREASNPYYARISTIFTAYAEQFAILAGRRYLPYEYIGDPAATEVVVTMGSSAEVAREYVSNKKGQGVLTIRLYRPWDAAQLLSILPSTVQRVAVLDRTKECGAPGEPLYLDIAATLAPRGIRVIGGRYGLSSKEFGPREIAAVFTHLHGACTHDFTVGITDDVTHKSLPLTDIANTLPAEISEYQLWGYGSDGTVSSAKNTMKIVGLQEGTFVQGYFAYDSRKSGGTTISHLRIGTAPIRAPYLVTHPSFVAVHRISFLEKYRILEPMPTGGTVLLNLPADYTLPASALRAIRAQQLQVWAIDANALASEFGLGDKISAIMQMAFFAVTQLVSREKAQELIGTALAKSLRTKGQAVIDQNLHAIAEVAQRLHRFELPDATIQEQDVATPFEAREFVRQVIDPILRLEGDSIPVSALSADGMMSTGTAKEDVRSMATSVPQWLPEKCVQCGLCSLVCPHGAIRIKQIPEASVADAPEGFTTLPANTPDKSALRFRVQVYPEQCTGCGLCIQACPTKALEFQPLATARAEGSALHQAYFDHLPESSMGGYSRFTPKGSQLAPTFFEFSGACSGCGETPYIKLLTSLFGERLIIANATGCSSIFGGTFPLIPYTKNQAGQGPAWANSLFEDNAEYALGMRLAVDSRREYLYSLLEQMPERAAEILAHWSEHDAAQEKRVQDFCSNLGKSSLEAEILERKDDFLPKSVWAVGGDGWAYDIGFGGLDHVLASGKNIKILVLDTEGYSNTGGQASKATPTGAMMKFASLGKELPKKDLGLMLLSYGYIYVAYVNFGADKNQLIKALKEAEEYPGPAIVIGYASCLLHGINMSKSQDSASAATKSGYWPLYRYDPRTEKFTWDSPAESLSFADYLAMGKRYSMLRELSPERAERLHIQANEVAQKRSKKMKDKA